VRKLGRHKGGKSSEEERLLKRGLCLPAFYSFASLISRRVSLLGLGLVAGKGKESHSCLPIQQPNAVCVFVWRECEIGRDGADKAATQSGSRFSFSVLARVAFEKMTGVDYRGETYYTIRNLSLYECQGWCREEPECAAASFR